MRIQFNSGVSFCKLAAEKKSGNLRDWVNCVTAMGPFLHSHRLRSRCPEKWPPTGLSGPFSSPPFPSVA